MDKNTIRQKYIALRKAFTSEEIEEKSLTIANLSLEMPIWDKEFYHIFLSIVEKKEINTDYLLHILQGKDKNICVPVMKNGKDLVHILLQDNTRIETVNFGVPEPIDGISIPSDKIEIVFVPLMAYDRTGNRIGYGKGFYDRFLSQTSKGSLFIGLSFFGPEDAIATDPHDIKLDYCITPEKIYRF